MSPQHNPSSGSIVLMISFSIKLENIILLSITSLHFFMKGHEDQASNNKYILAVDDDPDIITLIEQALHRQGLKVSAFTNPPIALEHFNANHNDCSLILSDIRMPGINGYEFVKQIKRINPKVKVILMSAFEINDKEFHNLLPDIKVDAFLQKPFRIQQLNEVIEKIST
jgi:DNA-binding NtrC family response regulator